MWDVVPVEAGGPFTVSGTRSGFSFDVPGGSVEGVVQSDDTITGTVLTDEGLPLMAGSVYACDPAGDETMTFVFELEAVQTVVLTAR